MFVVLFRHADIDIPPQPGDDDPGLNALGEQRAADLARYLGAAGVRGIYSSGARRANETVAPLAAMLGLTPRVQASTSALVDEIRAHPPEGVLCVAGHSNTVPEIIARLGADASGVEIGHTDFANLFVVAGVGSPGVRLLRLAYGAATP